MKKSKTLVKFVNANKMIQEHRDVDTDELKLVITREIIDGKLIQVYIFEENTKKIVISNYLFLIVFFLLEKKMKHKDVVCTRTFERRIASD